MNLPEGGLTGSATVISWTALLFAIPAQRNDVYVKYGGVPRDMNQLSSLFPAQWLSWIHPRYTIHAFEAFFSWQPIIGCALCFYYFGKGVIF